ncbi:nucleotide exchange factor GrpE [Moraxella osloensis]|uniref:Protein GrpE n=1 Tax=Faucicola osloensis TaxID=34062 RepID=A0A109WBT8_FAUOS|nr:nucleotide exchange factor GrpE [Moraxella osloensis]AME01540.1 molecular chaperone GrpE [Moraxella osloensis]ATR77829.1 nucleotide exchange factor GrpE [Moraxella osloensis]OBX52952.1 nucleotide exchange factor GrpE [Moraxella osloensis]PKZ68719.1 nucleotide exchange factor GrpE [Moraxella osloensis]QPT42722.1 nucleotide exchange factor GrpE [Moraxella osloensis]
MNSADNNQNTQPHNQTDATSNVLGEAISESEPTSEPKIIDSQVDLTTYQNRIAELEGQIKEAKEAQARANAEAYNARNRMEQETEKTKKFALEKFAKDLLDTVDNLERAIENSQSDNDPVFEGVKLTHKSLIAVLEKYGVKVVNPQGETFNADLHEAVGIDPEASANQVGQVLQKGYTLHERLLRPAMVRVGSQEASSK